MMLVRVRIWGCGTEGALLDAIVLCNNLNLPFSCPLDPARRDPQGQLEKLDDAVTELMVGSGGNVRCVCN